MEIVEALVVYGKVMDKFIHHEFKKLTCGDKLLTYKSNDILLPHFFFVS